MQTNHSTHNTQPNPNAGLSVQQGKLNDATLVATCLLVSRYPPFFQYSFGLMMDKLMEQLRYQANAIIVKENKVVAYAGWIVVNDADAKRWLAEGGELPLPNWQHGDAIIVTITVSQQRNFLLPLIRAVSHVCSNKKVYRMRSFQNGKEEMRRPPITGRTQSFAEHV